MAQFEGLRQSLWGQPGEIQGSGGKKKIRLATELAEKFLGNIEKYRDHVKEDPQCYGQAVLHKVRSVEKQYHEVGKRLGATGAGLNDETEIEAGSQLANLWEEISHRCPYYYRIKALNGEQANVSDFTCANSTTILNLEVLGVRNRSPIDSSLEDCDSSTLQIGDGNNSILDYSHESEIDITSELDEGRIDCDESQLQHSTERAITPINKSRIPEKILAGSSTLKQKESDIAAAVRVSAEIKNEPKRRCEHEKNEIEREARRSEDMRRTRELELMEARLT
ncbi:hypothetical protein L873DRAFT_1791726 [Choiromyces venosus 120613-1]|uniref:Uncharacterized protein n=1 Tax=Choiromyces venosus 120613-1 TaxID=1336337 RepID=A0A3N4JDB4_9PEZI|nr:hypothetical protein L873DRAFT_1791726 [Choiromyces venosus 120613-1]